jgi:hypothetical protein
MDAGTAPAPSRGAASAGTLGGTVRIAGREVRSVPDRLVSQAFTVPQLNLDVPVPASASVAFAFRTPAAGGYTWRCEATAAPVRAACGGPCANPAG